MDYVTRVLELLEQKVKSAVHSFEKRKQYIAQVFDVFDVYLYYFDIPSQGGKWGKIYLFLQGIIQCENK